jgi:hypothetical protein
MNDDDGALSGCAYVAFHDPAAHRKSFAKSLDRVLRYDLRPTPMGEVDRPTSRRRRLRRRLTLRREPRDGSGYQRARQRTQNEGARPQPNLEDVVGDDRRISLLLDDRITHAGVPSGIWPRSRGLVYAEPPGPRFPS